LGSTERTIINSPTFSGEIKFVLTVRVRTGESVSAFAQLRTRPGGVDMLATISWQ